MRNKPLSWSEEEYQNVLSSLKKDNEPKSYLDKNKIKDAKMSWIDCRVKRHPTLDELDGNWEE